MSNYKIIMTGGGTAGHVTPNLALVPKLKEKGFDIKYIGSYEGIEKEIIVDAGIPYFAISSGKLRRYFDMKNFTDPFKVIKGIAQANKILAKEKPDVIFLFFVCRLQFLQFIVYYKIRVQSVPPVCRDIGWHSKL